MEEVFHHVLENGDGAGLCYCCYFDGAVHDGDVAVGAGVVVDGEDVSPSLSR